MAKKGALRATVGKKTVKHAKPAPAAQRKIDQFGRSFSPFKPPTSPPSNAYDPALDAQLRAAERGAFDLGQDVDLSNERELADFLLGQQNLSRQRDEGLADMLRQRTELGRNYQRLGNNQAQAAAVAGVSSGGALVQAGQKRQANEEFDLQPIQTAETRLGQEHDRQQGLLSTQYQRGQVDRNLVQLPRAQRELGFFRSDIGQQRFFQAKQGGYVPPVKPANERTVAGLTVQVRGMKKPVAQRKYVTTQGRLLNRKQFVSTVQKRRAA